MFSIVVSQTADNFLGRVNKKNREITITKIKSLKENPKLGKPLVGKLKGLWSLRIGKYRAVYEISNNEDTIFIIQIEHRKNIYDKI